MPYSDDQAFKEWHWSHQDPAVVQRARQLLRDYMCGGWARKSAVVFDTMTDIEGGFALQWQAPAKKNAAQRWFWARFVQEVVAGNSFFSQRIDVVEPECHAGVFRIGCFSRFGDMWLALAFVFWTCKCFGCLFWLAHLCWPTSADE